MRQLDKIKKTAVVAIPSMKNEDWVFLQSLRKTYDSKSYDYIVPHFTLISKNNQFSRQELSKIFRANLVKQRQVNFSIRTALFMPPLNEHKSWYIFLVPDQGFSELVELHRHIYTAGLQLAIYKKFPFIPHITVGSFKCKTDCLRAVDEINKNKFELSGCIENISLIEENNTSAQVFEQIALQG